MDLFLADSKLRLLPAEIRTAIKFYAPLLHDLYYFGIDPVTFARGSGSTATWRDGASHSVAVNIPRFEYSAGTALGLGLVSGESLQYNALNNLDDSNTLIWFEDGTPKSTPTDTNPFDNAGLWTGSLSIHLAHIVKADRVLSSAEINQVQLTLKEVAQSIPALPDPPTGGAGSFVTETPSGTRNGVNDTFTLSQDPDLGSLLISAHGGLILKRVASAPDNLQYTAGGTGNRTITMGLAPDAVNDFVAQYVIAGS